MGAIVLLAAAAVAVTVARAQQPPEQERPTFRTGANMVRVDATVTDRRGNPVATLTADDFVVFETASRSASSPSNSSAPRGVRPPAMRSRLRSARRNTPPLKPRGTTHGSS
jgi:hypothetical protein